MTPIDLMRAILTAPVDLLYFGGIGTYVKASSESHADAGDRANDALRINGDELRAKVVGEGANLGFTQRGRVEAALAGRKINTDALDNSAGVDTSDHEVNIKIVTGEAISRGALRREDRDALLFAMTDEVGEPGAAPQLPAEPGDQRRRGAGGRGARPAGTLHARAGAQRPARSRRRVPARFAGHAHARPEPAVPDAARAVACCWPTPRSISTTRSSTPTCPTIRCSRASCCATSRRRCSEKHEPSIRAHRLRREITALQVVNSLVNRCGPTFVRNMAGRTGAPAAAIARAFAVVRDAWKLRDLWGDIEALDPALKAEAQIRMLVASQRFLTRTVQWALRRLPQPIDAMAATEQLAAAVAALGDLPAELIGEAESAALAERAAAFEAMGAPAGVARRAAALETLAAAGDLMLAARANGVSIEAAARLYFRLGERLSLARLAIAAQKLPREGQWPAQAALAVQDELVDPACRSSGVGAERGGPAGRRRSRRGDRALERAAQARARSRRPAAEGGSGGGRHARPRHALGRHGRVAHACVRR